MVAAPDEFPVRPGDVLGDKYRVSRLIGHGGMGVVVEAHHIELGERVAIKVLHERYLDNDEAVARFQHEAKAAVRIRGEHSARLIDVGTAHSGAPFIVMEYLEGCDLSTVLRQGQVPVRDACLYILHACEGMAEVHANGIIHRDLKPGNLFLTRRPDGSPLVKVLDFGIAKSAVPIDEAERALTMTLVSMGTPSYMSPEQVRSSRSVDHRADIWSLGTILYELLAGQPAFGGNSTAHITAQVLEAQPPLLMDLRSAVSPELDRVVRKCLAKPPDGRYVDVAEFAEALEPFAGPPGAGQAERAKRIVRGQDSLVQSYPKIVALGDEAPTDFGRHIRDNLRRNRLMKLGLVGMSIVTIVIMSLVVSAWRERTAVAGMPVAVKGVRAAVAFRAGLARAEARISASEATSELPANAEGDARGDDGEDDEPTSAAPPPPVRAPGPLPKAPLPPPPAPIDDDDIMGTRK